MEGYLRNKASYPWLLDAVNLGEPVPRLAETAAPALELDAGQAALVHEEVVRTLKGKPTEGEVVRALEDLRAACDAGHVPACTYLDEEFQEPQRGGYRLRYPDVEKLPGGVEFAVVVLQCHIAADGQMQGCDVIEDGARGFARSFIEQLGEHRFRPATLAGHRFASTYMFAVTCSRGGSYKYKLPLEQKMGWARLRVSRFPESPAAWTNLAVQLALYEPQAPEYPAVIERAYALAPRARWFATEHAWRQVQAGQYAAALSAIRPALHDSKQREHPNPYVLETAAAAHFGLRQCPEALAAQRQAVEELPIGWPTPERERFEHRLQEYEAACGAASGGPRGPSGSSRSARAR
ncbi:tetratricopeptide repeat protein [Corallococcus coralloides]|uniref:tetratricopeptide repeat protein n=1 Tax=Corallococcus coralloides TaxID=184914 RepID=UPI00384E106D